MHALKVAGSIQILWEGVMPSFIWYSTTLVYLENWCQGFLTMVSAVGFDTNPFILHKSLIHSFKYQSQFWNLMFITVHLYSSVLSLNKKKKKEHQKLLTILPVSAMGTEHEIFFSCKSEVEVNVKRMPHTKTLWKMKCTKSWILAMTPIMVKSETLTLRVILIVFLTHLVN